MGGVCRKDTPVVDPSVGGPDNAQRQSAERAETVRGAAPSAGLSTCSLPACIAPSSLPSLGCHPTPRSWSLLRCRRFPHGACFVAEASRSRMPPLTRGVNCRCAHSSTPAPACEKARQRRQAQRGPQSLAETPRGHASRFRGASSLKDGPERAAAHGPVWRRQPL